MGTLRNNFRRQFPSQRLKLFGVYNIEDSLVEEMLKVSLFLNHSYAYKMGVGK